MSGKLRDQMERQGISQVELGKALGLPQTAVSRRLRGLVPWTLPELEIVSRLLGLSLVLLVPEPDATDHAAIGA